MEVKHLQYFSYVKFDVRTIKKWKELNSHGNLSGTKSVKTPTKKHG